MCNYKYLNHDPKYLFLWVNLSLEVLKEKGDQQGTNSEIILIKGIPKFHLPYKSTTLDEQKNIWKKKH